MDTEKTQQDLGWASLIDAWAACCRTTRGQAAVGLSRPLSSVEAARIRILEVSEARVLEDRARPMGFGGIQDVGLAVARADKGSTLDAEEIVAVAQSAQGYHRLHEQLEAQQRELPLLWKRAEEISSSPEFFMPLLQSFEPDGRLADHASPQLGSLRRKVVRLQQSIEAKAKSLLDSSHIIDELQDKYWTLREDRYVLPVKVASRNKVPGIVHGSSGTGQTIFVEPHELVELNNAVKLAEYEVLEEEHRILAALSKTVGQQASSLSQAAEVVVALDVIGSAAKLATNLQSRAPIFQAEGRRIDLRRARHPLMLLADKECVANDVVVEEGQSLIVSGPNAGGKTVVLKTVGLAVMMSRHGLHIAAGEGSRLPWFSEVLTAIGDSQSLESELSTFSAHLTLLRSFLTTCGPTSLVLIDEVCSATEPEQGGALAQATLETLAQRQAVTLVSTHYERLKTLATTDPRFANASVGFDLERLAPTFRLHLGVPGASAAIDVARRLGIPEDVSLRAEELAGGGRTKVDELLREVSDEHERLIDERQALEEERAATAIAYEKASQAQAEADERTRKAHHTSHDEAINALRDARLELENMKSSLRTRHKVRPISKEVLEEKKTQVGRLGKAISSNAPKRAEPPGRAPSPEQLSVGTEVNVASLGGRGLIVEAANRGKVVVQVGAMKTKVVLSDLRLVPTSGKTSQAKKTNKGVGINLVTASDEDRAFVRSSDSTLDLRGARADEAVASVDRFIDTSLLCAREAIFVVHGHGTGALRTAVRAHLEGHVSVTKWRRGQAHEGGDGVTVAWLDT